MRHPALPSLAGRRVLLVTLGPVLRPRGGMQVRAEALVLALARLGVAVEVVSTEEAPARGEGGFARVPVFAPAWPPRFGWSGDLVRLVRARYRAHPVDAVIVTSAMLVPAVVAAGVTAPLVWDTNECETLHYLRLPRTPANTARLAVWRGLEELAGRRSRLAVAVSDEERGWWERIHPGLNGKLAVVPHGPPEASLRGARAGARARAAAVRAATGRTARGPMLLFVGNLGAKHNAAAAEWLLAELAPVLPYQALLLLAGPGTDRLALPRLDSGRVCAAGDVGDLDALVDAADVCLAPLGAGAGVKTKVLQYLARGRPVLGTPYAFEGLDHPPGVMAVTLGELPGALLSALRAGATGFLDPALEPDRRRWVAAHHGPAQTRSGWAAVLRRVLDD